MKTKMLGIAALAVALLATHSAPVYGQARNAESQALTSYTFGLLSPRLLGALSLTPEQAAKINASAKALSEANKAFVAEVTALRKDVADRLFGPNPVREADVAAQITKIADLREKILRDGFRIALEIRQTLRADQLAKAASIRQGLLEIQS